MANLICDFCQQPMEWTPEQNALDAALRDLGSPHCTGLGAMCDACDQRQIELYLAEMARQEAEELNDAA